MPGPIRKLAAVLAADVADYSTLVARDAGELRAGPVPRHDRAHADGLAGRDPQF